MSVIDIMSIDVVIKNIELHWNLTYPDTSVQRLTVRITEFPDKWVTFCWRIWIGSQTSVRISEVRKSEVRLSEAWLYVCNCYYVHHRPIDVIIKNFELWTIVQLNKAQTFSHFFLFEYRLFISFTLFLLLSCLKSKNIHKLLVYCRYHSVQTISTVDLPSKSSNLLIPKIQLTWALDVKWGSSKYINFLCENRTIVLPVELVGHHNVSETTDLHNLLFVGGVLILLAWFCDVLLAVFELAPISSVQCLLPFSDSQTN